jgi:hypothetical protein
MSWRKEREGEGEWRTGKRTIVIVMYQEDPEQRASAIPAAFKCVETII